MRLTDLSGTLENGLWGLETVATVSKNAFYSSRITATTISGLYLESQAHIIEGGKTLDEYPVERFFTPAKIVNPDRAPRTQIDGDLLSRHAPRSPPEMRFWWQQAGVPSGTGKATSWIPEHEKERTGVGA
jgi:kynurenine formamidase